jgi:transaldolase
MNMVTQVINFGARVGGHNLGAVAGGSVGTIKTIYRPLSRRPGGNRVLVDVKDVLVKPHVTDQMINMGAGTVFICADTSVVKETQEIGAYLAQHGIYQRKQTTNPTLLKQFIEKVGAAAFIEQMHGVIKNGDESLVNFKARMLGLGKSKFYFQATQYIYRQLLDVLGEGVPLSAEVDYTHGLTTAGQMVEQAKKIVAVEPFASRMVIKVPVTRVGLEAIEMLTELGIRTNATLIFTLRQAIEAAMAGATFTSPFAGRFTAYESKMANLFGLPAHEGDANYDMRFGNVGMDFVERVAYAYERLGLTSMIIPASIRSNIPTGQLDHLKRVWEISKHSSVPLVPTIPTKVLMAPESLPWLRLFHETTEAFDTDVEFGHPLLTGLPDIDEKGGLNNFDADSVAWKAALLSELGK